MKHKNLNIKLAKPEQQ